MTFRDRFLAYNLRTIGRIFEIQTAYVQVRSRWWQKNVVTENLLPVLTGNDFLLIRWELMDGFSKFKRHVFRFYCSYDQKFYRWKSTSGFNRKRLFDHNLRSNRRIFKIQTASFQVLLKWWFDIFDALNLLPVWTEKLKIGAKTLFSKKNPFRIERVTASIHIS